MLRKEILMVLIKTKNPEAQKRILEKILNRSIEGIDFDGELKCSVDSQSTVSKIFLDLLECNLVKQVTFEKIDESKEEIPKDESPRPEEKTKNKTVTIQERILTLMSTGKSYSTTEVAAALDISYSSAYNVLRCMDKKRMLDRNEDDCKYFLHKKSELIPEEKQPEKTKAQEAKKNPDAEKGNEQPSEASNVSVEEAKDDGEKENYPQYTNEEKKKIFKDMLTKSEYDGILKYMFPQKDAFVVSLAQERFKANQQDLTRVIRTLISINAIKYRDIMKEGSYEIFPIWRLYYYVLRNGGKSEYSSAKYAIQMGGKDFNKVVEEAVSESLIKKEDEQKMTILVTL